MGSKTSQKYKGYREQFFAFCKERIYDPFGDNADLYVAEFIKLKAEGKPTHSGHHNPKPLTFGTLKGTVMSAISDIYRFSGEKAPVKSEVLFRINAALRRVAKPSGQHTKGAIPTQYLRSIIRSAYEEESEMGLRDICIFLCGGVAFMRESEIVSLKRNNVEFGKVNGEDAIRITIHGAKNDPEGKSLTRIIKKQPASNNGMCLYTWLSRYMTQTTDSGSDILFTDCRRNYIGKPLAPTTPTHILRRRLKSIGIPDEEAEKYTSNTLRKRGVTNAIESGCSVEEIKTAGGWKSNAALAYYAPSDTTRANVTSAAANPRIAQPQHTPILAKSPNTTTTNFHGRTEDGSLNSATHTTAHKLPKEPNATVFIVHSSAKGWSCQACKTGGIDPRGGGRHAASKRHQRNLLAKKG